MHKQQHCNMVNIHNSDGFLAKIIVSVLVVILNYVFSKLIIFRNKDKKKDQLEKTSRELNK